MPCRPAKPRFGSDIAPRFRADDIACMKPMGVRLADPEWMTDPGGDETYPDHANARRVFATLESGRMPPDAPWPADDLGLYAAWMAQGFAR